MGRITFTISQAAQIAGYVRMASTSSKPEQLELGAGSRAQLRDQAAFDDPEPDHDKTQHRWYE